MKKSVDLICDIAELISVADAEQSKEELLQRVVVAVGQQMQADVCSVYLYDDSDQMLTLRATQGLAADAIGRVRLKLGEGITGRAVRELRPICVGSADQNISNRFFPGINEERYKALLAVPILRGLKRLGAIVVQSLEASYFSTNDIKVLRAIAAQLATVFENMELEDETYVEPPEEEQTTPASGQENLLRGNMASPGAAHGRAVILSTGQSDHCPLPPPDAVPHTVEDFEIAVDKTADQINQLQLQTSEELADVAVLIFSAHLLILEDAQFVGRIRELIENNTPAVKAIAMVVNEYVDIFSASEMPLIREKVLDVKDLGNRLTRNILNEETDTGDYQGQIIIAHELLPSDILKLAAENAQGFIISSGVTSHNAIICRSLGIPMVAISREAADSIEDDEELLMDADQGLIYRYPGDEVYEKYRELEAAWNALHNAANVTPETWTQCGTRVYLHANINLLSDLNPAREFKSEGVGLYRSEFPFIVRNDFPTEEEQYQIYRKLVDQMENRPVTFRTLDIGGDKMLSYYSNVDEANPFLGMRAIRFSLKNRDIFSQQLRAFLRAGAGGNTRIMFPLVSSVDDFIDARAIVYECMDQLEQDQIPFNRETQLGVMMELPSAVEVAEELAAEADFLSIGSNDLIQYMLAVDRTNEQVSNLYLAHHPAILRSINRIVRAALACGKDVSICGDLSADPRLLPFLLGIGLRKFSIDMLNAPTVQHLISSVSIKDSEVIAAEMLKMGRISDIDAFLEKNHLITSSEPN